MNTQKISPQGYNINNEPLNKNPFWEEEGSGGNVPAGGTTGQVLTKKSNNDYDTEWKTPESGGGLPGGGLVGDILTKTATAAEWKTPDYAKISDIGEVEAKAESAVSAAQAANRAVATEKNQREAADTAINGRIDTTSQEINDYKIVTNNTISELRQSDSDEVTARENGDSVLDNKINGVQADLNNYKQSNDSEIDTLNAEDSRLDGLITSEANARIDADALVRQDLTEAIQYETEQRENADSALRTLITENSSDISDQSDIISAQGARITATENDITDLKAADSSLSSAIQNEAAERAAADLSLGNRVTSAESTVSEVEASVSDMEATVNNLLPDYYSYNGVKFPQEKADFSQPSAVPTGALVMMFTPDNAQSKIVKSLKAGRLVSGSPPGGAIAGIPYVYAWPEGECRMGPVRGLVPNENPASPYFGCFLVYNRYSGSDTYAQGNASWTKPISGGTTGQVLTKKSNSSFDWEWKTPESGGGGSLPSGGSAGDLLMKNATGEEWHTPTYAEESTVNNLETTISEIQDDVEGIQQTCNELEQISSNTYPYDLFSTSQDFDITLYPFLTATENLIGSDSISHVRPYTGFTISGGSLTADTTLNSKFEASETSGIVGVVDGFIDMQTGFSYKKPNNQTVMKAIQGKGNLLVNNVLGFVELNLSELPAGTENFTLKISGILKKLGLNGTNEVNFDFDGELYYNGNTSWCELYSTVSYSGYYGKIPVGIAYIVGTNKTKVHVRMYHETPNRLMGLYVDPNNTFEYWNVSINDVYGRVGK